MQTENDAKQGTRRDSGVSVIICCYNSSRRITETLRFLCMQKVNSSIAWEVILVNNASSDRTVEVARTAWEAMQGGTNFVIVDQPIPGLASAREKGIEASKYDLLIFCDDDNHFEPNYIEKGFIVMSENPDVGVAGGWCKPKLPFKPGRWIEDFYPALAIGKQGQRNGYVDCVFGAGMIIRYDVFEKLDTRKITLMLTDRVGSKQTSGGDTEICAAAKFIGYKIYYSEQLILHHQISIHRLSWQSFIKANFRNVFPLVYLHLMQTLIKDHGESINRIYGRSLRRSVSMVLHFLPRVLFGRHRFYSFIMIYQNLQLFFWLLTRKEHFKYTAYGIKKNLYNGEK